MCITPFVCLSLDRGGRGGLGNEGLRFGGFRRQSLIRQNYSVMERFVENRF